MKSKSKYIFLTFLLIPFLSIAQEPDEFTNISEAERRIAPAYRITEKPEIIDTIIPTPNVEYPLLNRNMQADINLQQIEPSKIKIVDKLGKLYPGYLRLGIGNYASPLGELYYNSTRNRKMNYGIHLNHNSSFGNIKNQAPSTYDKTSGKIFGEFFVKKFLIETEVDYLNHGYHFYGVTDSLDAFPKDTLFNRVQGIQGGFKFSNNPRKDSAILLYTINTKYQYFHEFKSVFDSTNLNARNSNFMIGTDMKYKQGKNVYAASFDIKYTGYKYGENDSNLDSIYRRNYKNTLVHLRPTISTYGDKWKVVYGVDINFDVPSDQVLKVVPVIEAKYSLFNNMFIPYIGINGGVKQNTYYSLNRTNQFMRSSVELRNTRQFKFYAGIKGTLSKNISFNLQGYKKTWKGMPLFMNDTVFSDLNKFNVVYDTIDVYGVQGGFSYQNGEKLKIDFIGEYNSYNTLNQNEAWFLPELKFTIRGNYNLYDKIYIKADFSLEGGRKSPTYLFNQGPDTTPVYLGLIADANLHLEYRYSKRLSAFLQFNNLASQKYQRWYKYPVQAFQVMGGITFGF